MKIEDIEVGMTVRVDYKSFDVVAVNRTTETAWLCCPGGKGLMKWYAIQEINCQIVELSPGKWTDYIPEENQHLMENMDWNGNPSYISKDTTYEEAKKALLESANNCVYKENPLLSLIRKENAKCECGAASLGYTSHSYWCPKFGG